MFDDIVVVQSAVSAFNNAALAAPAFLWHGMLAMPLFVLVYFCGNSFLEQLGWRRDNILRYSGLFVAIMIFLWLVLFGGHYNVLRDQISVLPYLIAAVMFMISLFVSSNTHDLRLPVWRDASRGTRIMIVGVWGLVLAALAVSDTHAWWGPLLQICAFLFGLVVGRRVRSGVPVIAGTVSVMMLCVVAILMQPEFFRFGQLGNLSVFHLLAMLLFGVCAVAALVLGNVRPSGRIHRSAYVKLKWLVRCVAALGCVLFFLTESVPVFVGVLCSFAVLFAMSVWHSDKLNEYSCRRFWVIALCAFGVITTMPAITALGVLCWTRLPNGGFWSENRFLL